jgi:muramidase (phage lysozyme)
LQGVAGGAARAEDVLPKLANQIRSIARVNPVAAVTALEHLGLSPESLPLLQQGAERVAELRKEVESLYGNWDNYQAASERFTYAMGRLGIVADRTGMSIMTALEPALTKMLTGLGTWVDGHQKDIADFFDHLGAAVGQIKWGDVGKGIEGAGNMAKAAAQWVENLARRWDDVGKAMKPFEDFMNQAAGRGDVLDALGKLLATNAPMPGTGENRALASAMYWGLQPNGGASPRERNAAGVPSFAYDTSLSPKARGLLDTIAGTESGGRYDITYGGGRLPDYSNAPAPQHVITSGPNAGRTTSAFGRYQFENATWNEAAAALKLTDKSPASQDRAAWWLAQRDYYRRSGRNLSADLESPDASVRAGIGPSLRGTWTSLPGGIEATTNTDRFTRQLDENTRRETVGNAPAVTGTPLLLDPRTGRASPPERTPPPARMPDLVAPASAAPVRSTEHSAGGSTVRIQIDHNNVPAGVTMGATTHGDGAEIAGIRVRRAMPDVPLLTGP